MPYEEKNKVSAIPHNVIMEGREKLTVSGVLDIGSFNEQEIAMETVRGNMLVRGDEMHMEKLSVDSGDVILTGKIDSIEYENEAPVGNGFFSKLFR